MLRTLLAALALAALSAFVACGPPPKPTAHPGIETFGTPCAESKCGNDLECMRAGGYGGETGNCEKRCNYDDDCGLGAKCAMVEKAPAPVCRPKGT